MAKGNKGVPAGVNGVKMPSLLSIAPKRTLVPYLHLVLGLTNNVVQQMLAFLTSLGCVDPAVPLRQFDHCALLAELEDEYGICGVFGEDGCEALHVLDSLCRKMVRQIRNPEARHNAHTLHLTARLFTPVLDR